MKKWEIDRYDPDTSLKEVNEKLEKIMDKERMALEERQCGDEGKGPLGDGAERHELSRIQRKLDYLESLSEGAGPRMEGLLSKGKFRAGAYGRRTCSI